jgi:hypothetical protein
MAYGSWISCLSMVTSLNWTSKGSWFNGQQGQKIHLYSQAFRLAVGPTPHPIQWVLATAAQGLKWPQHEVDH